MAKLGETDPRWIVAERTDGTNVNNWHWTERNCMPWTEKTLPTLFENLVLFEGADLTLKISTVDSVKGEANINTRKGKVFHFYELDIKFKFEGTQGDDKVEGTIHIPELSFEYSPEEVEINVSVSKGKNKDKARDVVKREGLPLVRRKLEEFLTQFKGLRGDLKESKQTPLTPTEEREQKLQAAKMEWEKEHGTEKEEKTTTTTTTKSAGETVEFSTHFNASRRDIWDTIVDIRRVQAYSQSAASLDVREGGAFSIFNDTVTGEFLKLVPDEKIVQRWRLSHWPKDVYSEVTLTLKDSDGKTELHLKQTGVPSAEVSRVQHQWRENVFGRIRVMFGYGGMGFY